jgi:hypothetical protein
MALKKIYVSRDAVEANHRDPEADEKVFKVIDDDGEHWTNSIIILGAVEIRYDRTAGEGLRVWIETYDKVVMKDGDSLTGV